MVKQLPEEGFQIGRYKVRNLMKKLNLKVTQRVAYKVTTKRNQRDDVADKLPVEILHRGHAAGIGLRQQISPCDQLLKRRRYLLRRAIVLSTESFNDLFWTKMNNEMSLRRSESLHHRSIKRGLLCGNVIECG